MCTKYCLLTMKSPSFPLSETLFKTYIANDLEFQQFFGEITDLDTLLEGKPDPLVSRYVQNIQEVSVHTETEVEDRDATGFEKVIETQVGKVKIGFSRVRENRIYVEVSGRFLRGIKLFLADLCLIGAAELIPLDKSQGDGNIVILEWNKRKSIKRGIRYIHNRVESLLYIVDIEFETKAEMEKDVEDPAPLNFRLIIEPLI